MGRLMLYLNMSSNLRGVHKYGYVPSIQAANPVKPDKDKDDWWNEMCKKHGNNKSQGVHRQNYIPSLRGANPLKKDTQNDWWDEMCKKHGAKNHFPKDKSKENKSDE